MRKILFLKLLVVLTSFTYSQAPNKINYQGVARDASGEPILSAIDLKFTIIDNTNTQVHIETQTGIQPNSFGIFNTQIGLITAISPTISWQLGPYTLNVELKSGSTFTPVGSQQLVSVPYALYAQKSGNSLPTGTVNGQTVYWDNTSSTPTWKIDNNLSNDGNHVGIGLLPAGLKNKLHVLTTNPNDSSVVFASHFNGQAKTAAFRGVSFGTSLQNNSNPLLSGIYGGQFFGINSGTGLAVGAYGQSLADSLSVGLVGIGTTTTTAGKAIGIYASAPLTTGDNYAAIFDKGKVLIKDSLFLDNTANPGSVGDVLARSSTGKVRWQTPTSAGTGPFTTSANFVHLQNVLSAHRVVIGNTTPNLFGYGSKVTVYNPIGNNDTALSVIQNGSANGINVKNIGNGTGIYASTNAAGTSTNPGIFGHTTGSSTNNAGVYGLSTLSSGVKGFSQSFNGVWGESTGGVGVFGLSTQSGQAGVFLLSGATSGFNSVYIATNSNPAALKVETFGGGAAIEAKNSSTIVTSNNQALLLNNGHLAATGTNSNSNCIVTVSIPTITAVGFKSSNSNDVRGEVVVTFTPSAFLPVNQSVTVNVPFDKLYQSGQPYVLIEALNVETATLSRFIGSSNANGFTITFINKGVGSAPITSFNFKYFIIE